MEDKAKLFKQWILVYTTNAEVVCGKVCAYNKRESVFVTADMGVDLFDTQLWHAEVSKKEGHFAPALMAMQELVAQICGNEVRPSNMHDCVDAIRREAMKRFGVRVTAVGDD